MDRKQKGPLCDLASPPLAKAAEEEVRYANVAKVIGDHRVQIDALLRRLVERNLGHRRAE